MDVQFCELDGFDHGKLPDPAAPIFSERWPLSLDCPDNLDTITEIGSQFQ